MLVVHEGDLAPGTELGSYRIVRYLASGKTGDIYEAQHTALRRSFALKLLHPELANNPESVQRFLREGKVAARLDHPNIVRMHDLGVHEARPYLVMELLAGETLADRLRRGPMALHEAVGVAVPLAASLATAHQAGVVHRDLKPDNVMLVPEGHTSRPVVMDFGVSKLFDGIDLTNSAALLGTPVYMAPEQFDSAKHVDGRADQYALGALVYEMLAGRRLHDVDSFFELLEMQMSGTAPPLAHVAPGVPQEMSDIVERATDNDPMKRYPSIAAFGAALLSFAELRVRKQWEEVLDPSAAYGDTVMSIDASQVPGPPPGYSGPVPAALAARAPDTTAAAGAQLPPSGAPPAMHRSEAPTPPRTGLWIGIGAILVAAIGAAVAAVLLAG